MTKNCAAIENSTRLRSMFWMKNKADKHVRGLEDMAPNPECFRFGHGQKNVKKIARKELANLDVDVASQALGQTEIAAKPVGHSWIPFNILPASF